MEGDTEWQKNEANEPTFPPSLLSGHINEARRQPKEDNQRTWRESRQEVGENNIERVEEERILFLKFFLDLLLSFSTLLLLLSFLSLQCSLLSPSLPCTHKREGE